MLKAVIFDFDGTLADTLPALTEGINLTLAHFGHPTHTEAEVRTYINNGARALCRRALPASYREDEAYLDRFHAAYERFYATVYHHTDTPYEGIYELLAALHAQGMRIGVLSNKGDASLSQMCANIFSEGQIDAVQGVLEGYPTKPDPYLTHRLAERLGVRATECLMVGDSAVDVRTARNAGMRHVGVSWGFGSVEQIREAGGRCIIDRPAELLSLLSTL